MSTLCGKSWFNSFKITQKFQDLVHSWNHSTINLGAMFMDISSWKSSFAAYGSFTWSVDRVKDGIHEHCKCSYSGMRRISIHLRDLGFVFAPLALECVVTQVCNRNQTTQVAYMESESSCYYQLWGQDWPGHWTKDWIIFWRPVRIGHFKESLP